LTEREREILALIAQGNSNAAIAERLVLSVRTVEAHVRNIFLELRIPETSDDNRRVHAVLTYLRAAVTDAQA
jgi:DNA-binding NarL/FixJ family response regulator